MKYFFNFKSLSAGLLFLGASLFVQAQVQWSPYHLESSTEEGRRIHPNQATYFRIDVASLKHFLSESGYEPHEGLQISLPDPLGNMRSFNVFKSSLLAPELAEKYPQMATYTAVLVDNPLVTAKLDFTDFGFRAMVFAEQGSYFIDPVHFYGDDRFQVYWKSDYQPAHKGRVACKNNDPSTSDLGLNDLRVETTRSEYGVMRTNGTLKRNYRLALACTGEYAQAVTGLSAPSKSAVLSAMVTTMNRVNGIYERELSITMTLIGNNDDIIYTNPTTDPYNYNWNGYYLLDENQENLESVIGVSNFDIGHIFSTGGGGIASLASVCWNSEKAMGVTGSEDPMGDAFDVDYVAHEMGHQFGAEHTFNNCDGNENSSTAYEPGSGSTIMAYAGICGTTNNLQNNSDDYFHAASLDNILDYVSGDSWGGVGTCAITSPGASSNITIPDYTAGFVIPTSTAFELEAPTASWTSTSSLLYNWEPFSRGQIRRNETAGATATTAPIFRSYRATTNRVRSFPNSDSVHQNNYSFKGERTPTVARNLKLRLTAKGIGADGFGSVNTSTHEVTITYVHTGQPFRVTSPNTAVSYATGSTQTITWNVAGTTAAPISTANVDIYLSLDGGATYPILLAENVPNTGTSSVTIPEGTATTQGRIKVKGAGNVFYDVSDVNFTITGSTSSLVDEDFAKHFKVYPNPVKDHLYIQPNNPNQAYTVRISDILGREVYRQSARSALQIPCADWVAGHYIVLITDQNNSSSAVYKISR